MKTLIINPEIHALFDGIFDISDYQNLKEDIAKNGIKNRGLVATSPEEHEGTIVCGENRYLISEELGIEFPYDTRDFDSLEEMIAWAKDDNVARRQLSVAQKIDVEKRFIDWLRKTRQENKEASQAKEGEQVGRMVSNDTNLDTGRTREILAEKVGCSPATAQRALHVMENDPEKWERVVKGKSKEDSLSISGAYNEGKTKDTAHVSQATGEFEWYTPKKIIKLVKELMMEIDVDPASSKTANRIVGAKKFYTEEDDGLKQKWAGRVWMNPPYSQPLVTEFCNLFTEKYISGEITEGCVLVNNATETKFYQNMMNHCMAICFIKGRVKFVDANGESTGAPLQGQTILYFGDFAVSFADIFSGIGRVLFNREG